MLKNDCPKIFQNDVVTYLREALQKLDMHFASNRRQIASFLNAQLLCIETWVRIKSLKKCFNYSSVSKNWCIKDIYFLWRFYYRRDAPWTQITTAGPVRLEDNKVLKIPLFQAEKKYDRSSSLNLILLTIVPKNFFWLNSVIKIGRNVVSNHLSKVSLKIYAINCSFF